MKSVNTRFWNKYNMTRGIFTTYYTIDGLTVEVWATNAYTGETSYRGGVNFATVKAAFDYAAWLETNYRALYVRGFQDMEV